MAKMVLCTIQCRHRSRIISEWSNIAQNAKSKKEAIAHADKNYNARILRWSFTHWISNFRNKEKHAKANEHTNVTKDTISIAQNLATREQSTHIFTHDKENEPPNKRLSPISTKRIAPSFNSRTPKRVLDMEARRAGREQRRQILKAKQEEKQLLRKHHDDEQRRRKEEQELKVRNAYLQRKADEKAHKQRELARSKQAIRLASLHYKMTLCHRIFKRWWKVFEVLAFNEQKVSRIEYRLLS